MSQEAFKKIFDQHFETVRKYIYYRCGDTELATDIAQEAFMKLWEKQLFVDAGNIKGLLFKISGDIFINNFRRKTVAMNYMKSIPFDTGEDSTEQNLLYKELKSNYEKTLALMPENQRIVFLMNRLDDKKYAEIAKDLNISVKAVEKRMSLALNFLRHNLKG